MLDRLRALPACRSHNVSRMPIQGEYAPTPVDWVRQQVDTYERTEGSEANTLLDTGLPIVIVTTRGARTGKVRKIALMRVEHEGEYALVGSMGGAPRDPVWVQNLRTHPDQVMVQDGPEPFDMDVLEVDGDERAAWWDRSVAAFPPYAQYEQRTERRIPVFVARRRA